ncbi:MAG: ATPase [Proteobacteria bacterium]|nr:ATPase [Pseudomonadota bacterium]
MRDDLTKDWFGDGEDPARYDPVRTARAAMKKQLPKRFYAEATVVPVSGGFGLSLDGRSAKTKLKRALVAEDEAVAQLLAAEWGAQVEVIDPVNMPVTRILHAAIDHVADAMDEVRADVLKYAGSDLLCYRATDPDRLVALQAQHWDPVLAHFRDTHGARFLLSAGITFVEQPAESLEIISKLIGRITSPQRLAALHVVTTISGSALIALALEEGVLEAGAAFEAGEVDGDFEVSVWGTDDEARERRENRWCDFRAAAALLGRAAR